MNSANVSHVPRWVLWFAQHRTVVWPPRDQDASPISSWVRGRYDKNYTPGQVDILQHERYQNISKSYPVMAPSKITFHITSLQSSMLRLLKGRFLKWRSFEHAGLQNGHQSVKAAILLEELLNRKWLPHGLIHLNSNQHWLTTLGYHTVLLLSGSHPFWLYRFSVAERQGWRQTNGIHEESGTCRLQLPSTWRRMTFEGCPMAPTVLNSSCTPVAKHGQWLCSMTTW